MPEPSGSMRSQRTTSGSFFWTATRPSASEAADSTLHPSSSNTMVSMSRRDASSSTMRRSTARLYFAAATQHALQSGRVAALEPFGDVEAFLDQFRHRGGARDARAECWGCRLPLVGCLERFASFAIFAGDHLHDSAVL